MQRGNVFGRVRLYLCLTVRAQTFESFCLQILFLVCGISSDYLGKVVYKGHRIKAKVTGAKSTSVCHVRG